MLLIITFIIQINIYHIMEKNEFTGSKIFSFNESIDYSGSAIVSKTIIKKDSGNISLFAFDKGETISEHTANYDVLVQIIDGQAEITINGKPYKVISGQNIILPANAPHAVKGIERFKMLLTMIKA